MDLKAEFHVYSLIKVQVIHHCDEYSNKFKIQ